MSGSSVVFPTTIAGHPRAIVSQGWCACGIMWAKLRYVTADCIGKAGYAHVGNLNETEFNEVQAEVAREAIRISSAMADLGKPGA